MPDDRSNDPDEHAIALLEQRIIERVRSLAGATAMLVAGGRREAARENVQSMERALAILSLIDDDFDRIALLEEAVIAGAAEIRRRAAEPNVVATVVDETIHYLALVDPELGRRFVDGGRAVLSRALLVENLEERVDLGETKGKDGRRLHELAAALRITNASSWAAIVAAREKRRRHS